MNPTEAEWVQATGCPRASTRALASGSMREFLDFIQALAVGCGHGLAPNPSRCQQEESANQS